MERYSSRKQSPPGRDFEACRQPPRSGLGMIWGSQGNQALPLFNKINSRGGGKVR